MEENKDIVNNSLETESLQLETQEKVSVIEEKKKDNKSSKLLTIIIIILLLVGIGFGTFIFIDKYGEKGKDEEQSKKPEPIVYTEEVRIDASLATQPLTDAYFKGLSEFNIKAEYTNTDPAYTKLINGETDLIIVTKPSEGQQKRADDAGVELVLTPVVNEGFVFYTNVNNAVNNLTLDEVRGIYTGAITNWLKLNGDNAEIVAYQRPANSGSQAGIIDLVMNGQKMKEPSTTEYVETMAGIIDVVSNYENGKYAIGYSYYYYATTMYGNDKMKFFSIDGVEPTHQTIKDETYPLITSYYIVTRKDNKNETVNKLKEAMLSTKGQEIAKNAGYVELG